jgi:hypothetical protein
MGIRGSILKFITGLFRRRDTPMFISNRTLNRERPSAFKTVSPKKTRGHQ